MSEKQGDNSDKSTEISEEERFHQDRATPFEILLMFLRMGVVAFGGPVAHVGMMQNELVQKRKWVRR